MLYILTWLQLTDCFSLSSAPLAFVNLIQTLKTSIINFKFCLRSWLVTSSKIHTTRCWFLSHSACVIYSSASVCASSWSRKGEKSTVSSHALVNSQAFPNQWLKKAHICQTALMLIGMAMIRKCSLLGVKSQMWHHYQSTQSAVLNWHFQMLLHATCPRP